MLFRTDTGQDSGQTKRNRNTGLRRAFIIAVLAVVPVLAGCLKVTGDNGARIRLPNRAPDARLPHAAILATGNVDEPGTVSDGVLLAYESLNRAGVPTVVRDRTLLADSELLNRFGIIVAPTLFGYHDMIVAAGRDTPREPLGGTVRPLRRNSLVRIPSCRVSTPAFGAAAR